MGTSGSLCQNTLHIHVMDANENSFTDSPQLPNNLLLGSIRLLVWLFFHPSAWHNHLHRLNLDLSPNFCFAELSGRQLSRPAFWRLLFMLHLFWPIALGISLTVSLILFDYSPLEAIPLAW